MAIISGYDSSSISTLFSSLNTGNKTTGAGSSDLLGISYTDYACIRSGSYFQLMKAYYADPQNNTAGIANVKTTTATSKDSAKKLAVIESSTESLNKSAEALYKNSSLFQEKTITDKDGNKTKGYDTEAIYKAVSQFVSDYNSVVETAGSSESSKITNAASAMVNTTTENRKLLSAIGITFDSSKYTMKIDKDAFEKADMNKIKTLFQGTGSYAYSIEAKSSMVNMYAKSEASKSNTYGASGGYTYNYSTGELYNTTT